MVKRLLQLWIPEFLSPWLPTQCSSREAGLESGEQGVLGEGVPTESQVSFHSLAPPAAIPLKVLPSNINSVFLMHSHVACSNHGKPAKHFIQLAG